MLALSSGLTFLAARTKEVATLAGLADQPAAGSAATAVTLAGFAITVSFIALVVSLIALYVSYTMMTQAQAVRRGNEVGVELTAVAAASPRGGAPSPGPSPRVRLGSGDSTGRERFFSLTYEDESEIAMVTELPATEGRMDHSAPAGLPRRKTAILSSSDVPPLDFNGCWRCTDTWGLDEFLTKMGVGRMQRYAATKAPWPTWEFHQAGHKFKFVNRGALGDIIEEFVVGGPEYSITDLKGNIQKCKAFWNDGKLRLDRTISGQGDTQETRDIKGKKLEFVIHAPAIDCSWGRNFERVD